MIKKTFEYLVYLEVQKANPKSSEDELGGSQDGFIQCLSTLFGQADDEAYEKAYKEGKSWEQITEKIINDPLVTEGNAHLGAIQEEIAIAVENFLLEHFEDALVAIQTL